MKTSKARGVPRQPGWLERLGIVGLEAIEWPLLASLAGETPLLLIGPHGTAKSLLLTRIAQALGLTWRHYNASLLNFDDLVGFPLPGPDRSLEYVKTPASIWGAGAVIFDEISRCRPDVQNKLFPIIHERRVQGLPLEGLRHRWAAMNPPCRDGQDEDYAGSEPLDKALADRFGFIVPMPEWSSFSPAQQLAVIRSQEHEVGVADEKALAGLVARTRVVLCSLEQEAGQGVAQYVQVLLPLLAQAGLACSPRRASMIYRAVLGVAAAAQASAPATSVGDAALVALRCALPQRAEGLSVPEVKVLAAHREAMRAADLRPGDPLRAILAAQDPLERLGLALRAARLAKSDFSTVAADSLAQLPAGGREAAIVHLFETGAVGRLNAAVASQVGEVYRDIATAPVFSETLHSTDTRWATWGRLKDLLSRLDPSDARSHLQANALAALFAAKKLQTPQDAERAFEAFAAVDQRLGTL